MCRQPLLAGRPYVFILPNKPILDCTRAERAPFFFFFWLSSGSPNLYVEDTLRGPPTSGAAPVCHAVQHTLAVALPLPPISMVKQEAPRRLFPHGRSRQHHITHADEGRSAHGTRSAATGRANRAEMISIDVQCNDRRMWRADRRATSARRRRSTGGGGRTTRSVCGAVERKRKIKYRQAKECSKGEWDAGRSVQRRAACDPASSQAKRKNARAKLDQKMQRPKRCVSCRAVQE